MRIYVNKINNDQPIFGALVFDLISFVKRIEENGKDMLIFETKKHGQIYCSVWMARNIAERLRVNGLDDSVIISALNSLQSKNN